MAVGADEARDQKTMNQASKLTMNTIKKTLAIGCGILLVAGLIFFAKRGSPINGDFEVATIAPLTGAAAELGRFNINAAQLFVSEINTNSKTAWHLTVEDSKSSAKDGVQAVQAILAKGSPKVIMTHQGSVSVAVAPAIATSGAVMLYIGAADAPKAAHPLAFRIYPDPLYVARQTIEQVVLPAKIARLGVFYVNDEFGVIIAKALREKASGSSVKIVFDEGYNPTTTDFRSTLAKLESAGAQALFVVGVGAPLGRVIAQAREAGFKGLIVGSPELQFTDVLKNAGEAAEGAQFLDLSFTPDTTEEPAKSFVAHYVGAYGTTPSAASAIVYDAWAITARALATAPSRSPSDIARAIIALREHQGVSGRIQITSERDFVYTLVRKTIRAGRTTAE